MRRSRLSLTTALVAGTSAALLAVPAVADAAPKQPIPVQIIAMNDFHGRITPQSAPDAKLGAGDGTLATAPGTDGLYGGKDDIVFPVGGAPSIAANVARLQDAFHGDNGSAAKSVFVGAGDLVSASPFESSLYKDEPTIEALNAMGLNMSSVGNHEFDRGTQELRRISAATDNTYSDDVTACEGVTVGVDGCFGNGDGHDFEGAKFPYLAANVVSKKTGEPMLPPYQVFDVGGGQRMALIGVVTDTTPTIVSPLGIEDVTFIDEAEAINRWVPRLIRQGIKAIGVLVHEGGVVDDPNAAPYINNCTGLKGDLLDINSKVSDQVDLIVSAHTHQAYNCLLPGPDGTQRLVTSAGYYGRLLSDIRVMIKPQNGDVDRSATYKATNVPVRRDISDPKVQGIVDYWNGRAAAIGNVPVGSITGDIVAPNGAGERDREASMVNFIADTQLYAMQQDPAAGNPVIAFMNPGGARKNLVYAPDGVVTTRELFDVQPFSNTVNTITLTGAQIDDLLEEQFPHAASGSNQGRTSRLILGVSKGFTFSWDATAPEGERVPDDSIKLDGNTLDPAKTYRVAANGFLIPGGDSFDTFKLGTGNYVGMLDFDASVAYFKAHPSVDPKNPPLTGRSLCTMATGCPAPLK